VWLQGVRVDFAYCLLHVADEHNSKRGSLPEVQRPSGWFHNNFDILEEINQTDDKIWERKHIRRRFHPLPPHRPHRLLLRRLEFRPRHYHPRPWLPDWQLPRSTTGMSFHARFYKFVCEMM
jgi:hypothetical protein